jgi:mannose-6-phosphate isomerase
MKDNQMSHKSVFKLKNQIKHYEWGSQEWIPQLLGEENLEGLPYAEMWMGIHPDGMSEAEDGTRLDQLIAEDPFFYLGRGTPFDNLPFLFKLLAAGKPLSIQAHPSKSQALAGFEKENVAGIPIGAANRNYKDANPKPELICALTPFKALSGFREDSEIHLLLNVLDSSLDALKEAFDSGLRPFLETLFQLSPSVRQRISGFILEKKLSLIEKYPDYADVWMTSAYFAEMYYGDPAVLAPFYLNLINLAVGDAMFIPAGVLHSYINGFGIELMTNSNNVLRGGLTTKYVDVEELLSILQFSAFKPEILRQETGNPNVQYPSQCAEFALSVIKGGADETIFCEHGPSIVIVTYGELVISGAEGATALKQGESAFIAADKAVSLSGNYTVYHAGTRNEPV